MAVNKKLLAIFAIFLVLVSVSAISAADNETVTGNSQVNNESLTPSDDELAPNEKNPDGVPAEHQDEDEDSVGDNPYRHGEKTPNEKAFDEEAAAVKAAGGESKTVSASGSPTTGNPVLVLLAAMAVLGAYPLSRRK